jgi:hypothetical protein
MLFVALALSGCGPVKPVVTDPAMAVVAAGRYPVTVERGRWAGLNSTPIGVYVDRKLVATVGGGQVVTMYVAEGRHSIGVGPYKGSTERAVPMDELAVDVSAASQPILHTNVSAAGWGGWKIERL